MFYRQLPLYGKHVFSNKIFCRISFHCAREGNEIKIIMKTFHLEHETGYFVQH